MSSRFTAAFRRLYHKMALILLTLWKSISCVCRQKLPWISAIFQREVKPFTYIRVSNVEKHFILCVVLFFRHVCPCGFVMEVRCYHAT